MIQRLCPRCRTVLHLEEENTLSYCSNCGAPQVTLSEELQEQAAEQMRRFAAGEAGPSAATDIVADSRPAAPPDPTAIDWRQVIRLAAMIAGVISAIAILLPPLELLAWTAPAILLAIYTSRSKQIHVTTELGARIGVLCGIFTSVGLIVITTLQMLLLRFGLHRMGDVQANMNSILMQAKARAIAESGQAAGAMFNPFITLPEFRVGFFLTGLGVVAVILLALSTAGGAFSGFMRSRQRAH